MGCSSSSEAVPVHQQANPHPQHQHLIVQQQGQAHSNQTTQNHQYQQQQQQQPPPQQPQQQPQANNENAGDVVNPVVMDRNVIERYLQLEREIHQLEGKNVLRSVKVKLEEHKDLEETIKQLQQHHQQCVQKTKKEKADVEKMQLPTVKSFFREPQLYEAKLSQEKEKQDVDNMMQPSVKAFFQQQQDYDSQLSKEQEEYLDALNEQEIVEKQLAGVTKQRDALAQELQTTTEKGKQLQALQQEQDDLLAGIFNGKYGSALENRLEMELDSLLDRKQRIGVAHVKWQNGRVLLQHAVNQLAFASRRWQEILQVSPRNNQAYYTMATETRNNLIAASQNIISAQRYLHTIQFPYCKPDEMQTLSRAVNNIYTDMKTPQRHSHALNCYETTHKRCAALLQWFDHVINNTIVKDQQQSNIDVAAKYKALRAERLRLMKAKMHEAGADAKIEELDMHDDDTDQELMALALEADDVSTAGELSTGQGDELALATTGEAGGEKDPPPPLPLNELAPAPNSDDLFGNINELKDQHEKEMAEFNKAQESNKARMDQGLQEKLAARRSRKRRQEGHEQQS